MIWLHIEVPFHVAGWPSPEGLEEHVLEVLDHLMDLEGRDHSIAADLSTGQVLVELVIDGQDEGDALSRGLSTIRSAIHAGHGATLDWPTVGEAFPALATDARNEWTYTDPTFRKATVPA